MLKLAGLGLGLILLFQCCCWGLGTNLGGWSSDRGVGVPGLSGRPGGSLPVPGLGNTKVEIGKGPDFEDMPRYPGATPAGQEITLPGPLALALGGLTEAGSEFRLYQTNEGTAVLSSWYKQQMGVLGWQQESFPFDSDQAALLSFKKPGATGFILIAAESDSAGQTQIIMIRARERVQSGQ